MLNINSQDFTHQDILTSFSVVRISTCCVSDGENKIFSVSPELLLHLLRCVDNKHLIHVVSQHVAGVANVHRCL